MIHLSFYGFSLIKTFLKTALEETLLYLWPEAETAQGDKVLMEVLKFLLFQLLKVKEEEKKPMQLNTRYMIHE